MEMFLGVTLEDGGHSVLGVSGQNRAEVGNKLRRTMVHDQRSQTITTQKKTCEEAPERQVQQETQRTGLLFTHLS